MQRGLLLFVLGIASACGANANAPGTKTSAEDASAPTIDAAAIPTSCTDPFDASPPGSTCILGAKGKVEDLSGAPLGQLEMTFCGGVCFGTKSDPAGAYSIPIGITIPTQDYAMHANGRPDHAVDYLRLTASEPSIVSVTMRLPSLPPSNVQLPPDNAPASGVTVGDVTLHVAAGTYFDLDIDDFGSTAGRTLRVASVPLASAPGYAAAAKVDAIYALAPSGAFARPSGVPGTTSVVKMGISLKNAAGLAASTAVDFMVLGDDYASTPPTVGLLAVAASGHVSADGKTIDTDPGEGISELTWLAVRRKGN
jgi:hypothetical protein